MKVNVPEGAEFFIASSSCDPGGKRFHMNICLNDFNDAIEFSQNHSPYDVFVYGWNMYVWHYKMTHGKALLVTEIDLNKYVKGAIDQNDNFVGSDSVNYLLWDDYKKVVYYEIPHIELVHPISASHIVAAHVPEIIHEWEIDAATGKPNTITTSTVPRKEANIFLLHHGYQWEDTDTLFAF